MEGITVYADLDLEYTYQGKTISAQLSAYYEGENVYLKITSLNGKPVNMAVSCNIAETSAAVENLIAALGLDLNGNSVELPSDVSTVTDSLLSLDFSEVLTGVYSDKQNGLGADINLDCLTPALGLENYNLGSLRLNFANGALAANLESLGLNVILTGHNGEIPAIDTANAVELSKLINFVNAAYSQVNGIIEDKSLAFEIAEDTPAYITVDGIRAAVYGRGEVSWKKGATAVALDLSMSIAEGEGLDEVTFKFIYNESAGADEPLVTVAINTVALEIYKEDIEGVKTTIDTLTNSLSSLLGKTQEEDGVATLSEQGSAQNDDFMYAIISLLSGADFSTVLNDMTATADGSSVMLTYLEDNFVKLSADERGIELSYGAAIENGGATFATGAVLRVSKAEGTLAGEIKELISKECTLSSSKNGESFIKLVYDTLFGSIRSISVEDILGDNVYNISFDLNGKNTAVSQLKNVFVHAEAYVVNNGSGGTTMQLDLNFNIQGAVVNGSVIIENDANADNTNFYIDLTQVLNITLNGLKVKASQETLFETVEALVSILTDTNVLQTFMPAAAQSEETGSAVLSEEQAQDVSDILLSVLTSDLASNISGGTTGEITRAYVNLDGLMSAFGINVGSLGVISCEINHATHAITSSAKLGGMEEEWLSLSSQRLTPSQAQEQYAALKNLDMSDYIDIAFLPPLVNDLSATVTDENGNMYQNLTFRGEISAKVLSFLNINISDVVLTVNLDPENFYLAFEGNLSGAGVSSNTIGLTYQDNYITLRRGNEYRVMTMSYFLDKMLVSDESSSLNFLLDSGLWGVVVLGLNASGITVDSGLTTPTDYYLYSTETKKVYSEVTVADYVNAISVVLGGQNVLDYKSDINVSTTLSNLGLSGDYYAFDLNARLLTDNVLTALSAAIMRNSDGSGVTGIKAYGAIESYVTFNLNLGYSEANNSAPLSSHYEAVEEGFKAALAADTGIDDNTIFGCYNSGDGSVEHQTLLTAYTFNVKDPDGTITTHTVRDGSTVHLYDNYNPEYSDDSETKRVVYYLNGNLCSSFVMSAEMNGVTVQKAYAEAVDLTVHNPEGFAGDFTYHTFIGDKLPESFEGYILTSGEYTLNGTPVAQITELGKDHIAGGTQIIGSFAYSSRTVNNIIYSYDVSRGGFAVTGTAAGFQQYYIYENRTVVLENQIDGIPVVAIGASAFQNTSYDSDGNIDPTKSIKNIVVPANITYVGESAFKDNVGMQSAVFLAESVTFAGSGTDGESTYPFYGCSTYATDGEVNGAKGNEQTVLNVYVNSVTNSNDDWKLFRYVLQVIVPYRFYIGDDGGSVVSSGWQYSSVAVENSTEYDIESEVQTYVKDGLNTTVYENTAIVSALQEVVDGYTAEKYNAIGYYVVSVTSSKDSFGVMQYTVNLLPAQANEIYYVVSVNNGACGGVDLTGDVRTFNGNTYARGAVTFTAKDINAGYEFTSFTANGISYFTNPATIEITSPTEVVTVCEANIVNVTIVSRVSFTYAGVTYEPGTASVPVALDENDNLSAVTPVSAGYTFLGWAAADAEGALTFSTLSDPASTYYTIWAVAKEGITYSGLGNTVSASFTGGTLYGWYADADYTREISNEISTENTIFNIRRQYSLTYGISGSGTQYQDTATMSGNSYALSASKTATIYEGQIVEIARTNDKHDITITIDGVNYTTLKLIKFQIIFNIHYTFKDDYFSNGESFSFVASQDASYTFKY